MSLFQRIRSFLYTKRTGDVPTNGKDVGWYGRHSSSLKELTRYVLQHSLMIVAYTLVRLYFLTIRIDSINEEVVVQHLKDGGKVIAAWFPSRSAGSWSDGVS